MPSVSYFLVHAKLNGLITGQATVLLHTHTHEPMNTAATAKSAMRKNKQNDPEVQSYAHLYYDVAC